MRPSSLSTTFLVLLSALLATAPFGCRVLPPTPAVPAPVSPSIVPPVRQALAMLARGQQLEVAGDAGSAACYYSACRLAWQELPYQAEAVPAYNTALARLLSASARMGRLDPTQSLTIDDGRTSQMIPVVHHGFAWQASDFQRLHAPAGGHEPLLSRRYQRPGVGLPLVVERSRDRADPLQVRFLPERSFFAATALLRFERTAGADEWAGVLEFHNPTTRHGVRVGVGEVPLTADLSASLAKTLEEAPRTYLAGFIEPGQAKVRARLAFLEPYQPGKAPVVLIHGLYSDPQSWADLINDLRASPGFLERYQLWVFRYPTGQGFLQSASALRTELREAVFQLESGGADPALHDVVLIGHSMGGLVAKLQVTYSEEAAWSRLANRPLDAIHTDGRTRAFLAETCFFDPSPDVKRVIFIAAPHAGALPLGSLAGRGAALLVEPSPAQAAMHEQLIRDNPCTFHPRVERRFPTSLDMLLADSPLLEAMRVMCVCPGVALHNIVGTSHPISLHGPSDGIVSVSSANHPGCQSTLYVDAKHTRVHRVTETTAEILRVLCAD